jgi:hypothetical protein
MALQGVMEYRSLKASKLHILVLSVFALFGEATYGSGECSQATKDKHLE